MGFLPSLGTVVNVLTNPASIVTDKLHDALPGPLKDLSLGHLVDKTIREKVTDGIEQGAQKLASPQQGSDGVEEDPAAAIKSGKKKGSAKTVAEDSTSGETKVGEYNYSVSSEEG